VLPGGDRVSCRLLLRAAAGTLHAGAAEAAERGRLECLYRYSSRPAICTQRLSLSAEGNIRYALKTPYRDGTTHVVFEPLDFRSPGRPGARAEDEPDALSRRLRPNHRLWGRIVPGPGDAPEQGVQSATEGRAALAVRMTWARRLKRLFALDIQQCEPPVGG
jgi:hypothetical protein